MPRRFRGWVLVLALVVIVALVVVWRSCSSGGGGPDRPLEGFTANGVALDSPDLDLELLEVRGKANPGYTDWACIFLCREKDGCRAETEVRILYTSEGAQQALVLNGHLDAARGEKMRVGRMQRPPVVVDRITKVSVEVKAPFKPGAPRPTPVQ